MEVVTAPDIMAITLDPEGLNGPPEIVWVTDHAASSTSATIDRHKEGTLSRDHPLDTVWVNAMTAVDIDDLYAQLDLLADNALLKTGGTMTGSLILAGAPVAALEAATKGYVDAIEPGDPEWDDIIGKPSTFPPTAHDHAAGDIVSGLIAIARIPTGTSSTVVALGNHSHQYISSTVPKNVIDNSYASYRLRNVFISSTTPPSTDRQTGDIWFKP